MPRTAGPPGSYGSNVLGSIKAPNKQRRKRRILIFVAIIVMIGLGVAAYSLFRTAMRSTSTSATPLEGMMLTPSIHNSDFYSTEAYGGPSAPWGFYHNGIDYVAAADHEPIQAAAAGKVVRLEEHFNQGSRWQVELSIEHGQYQLQYAFEIFSGSKADIDAQMNDIQVKLGQTVQQGQLLGYLHKKQEGAHVHFGILLHDRDAICPDPFFTAAAHAATVAMIQKTYPGATLCYPADPSAPRQVPSATGSTPANH